MISCVNSIAYHGIDVLKVDVQVSIRSGVPKFSIVGLADKTVAESRERVESSLASLGISLPAKKIIVNLSPADLIKEGSHFDLPIALGILVAAQVISQNLIQDYIVIGELGLDGSILPINGALPAAVGSNRMKKGLICSAENGQEAAWSGNDNIIAANNLLQLINHFKGNEVITPPQSSINIVNRKTVDLSEIKGQKLGKRALEISAAGGHNMLMFGPPGSGKSMLAQSIVGIIPQLNAQQILECSMISSIVGDIKNGALVSTPPFRNPHHSCSMAAMIGGGSNRRVRPGEISLAHNGILFLDELPEFDTSVIDALRQPIENNTISIARSGIHMEYPSKFQLIAAMNPCKCGYLGDESKACSRAPKCSLNYQAKVSGPMMDRFDIHIEIGNDNINYYYQDDPDTETSEVVLKRVLAARKIQQDRFDGYDILLNKNMSNEIIAEYAIPDKDGLQILNDAANKFKFSMRSYNKILKVARTIADLESSKIVKKMHICEAISYRKMTF